MDIIEKRGQDFAQWIKHNAAINAEVKQMRDDVIRFAEKVETKSTAPDDVSRVAGIIAGYGASQGWYEDVTDNLTDYIKYCVASVAYEDE